MKEKLDICIILHLVCKGYITSSCCGGHLEDMLSLSIYVAFENEHNFGDNIPEGAKYSKVGKTVGFDFPKDSSKEIQAQFQKECIEKLEKWADTLPDISE